MDFFKGTRSNSNVVIIKVGNTMGVTCSDGFSRPKDTGRWVKANGSMPEYLRLLLALKEVPTMSTETVYKSAEKLVKDDAKAFAKNRLVPEGEFDAAKCYSVRDSEYQSLADLKALARDKSSEITGLNAYIRENETGKKAAKGPTKAENKKAVFALIATGKVPSLEQLAAAGFKPEPKVETEVKA